MLGGEAAADAWAAGGTAGLGGWWCERAAPGHFEVHWFRLELAPSELPRNWRMSPDAALDIAFYEALAQVLLCRLRLRGRNPGGRAPVALRQGCDNLPTVGATGKAFTTSEPLCWALMALASVVAAAGADLAVHHRAGQRNERADAISRWREPGSQEVLAALDPAKEVPAGLRELLLEVWPRGQA